MRGSSVTAARSCLQPLVSANRYLAVHALPGDPLYFIVDVKSKLKDVYAKTCQLLEQQGMQDCELFGLAILSDGEYLFVDPESKLSKHAPKNWRSSSTYGLDSSGRPAFVLYFRVRYYVGSVLLLSDETTRHHYYRQLRDNVVRHGGGVETWQGYKFQHPMQSSNVYGPLLSLAGLALQADLGDYNEDRKLSFCKPSDYLPAHMCHEDNALSVLAAHHKDNRGLSREEAELSYIKEAILLEAPLNAHLYRLRSCKNEPGPGRVLLAVCARGVRIYAADEESPQSYTWSNIGKLHFDRKKFEIRLVDPPIKLTMYCGCEDKSKLLLAHCRDTHQFSMAIAPRVIEAKRQEEEERKVMRDMYPARCKLNSLRLRSSMRADQRISLISSTSSNTTSGIVSDRAVHSEDEPDLAAAAPGAVVDPTPVPDKISTLSRKPAPVSSDDEAATMPPPPAPPASLASSNCSTVVSPPPSRKLNESPARAALINKLGGTTSTRSSFEFACPARTAARNSPLDPCAELVYDGSQTKSLKYAEIGSETSGVYTLHSSEMMAESLTNDSSVQSTTDEASVTSGFYTIHSGLDDEQEPIYSVCRDEGPNQQSNVDKSACERTTPLNCPGADELDHQPQQEIDDADGTGRPRSNSILSVGSFRGDGSDPAADQGPLLSADELSDLIVGRCYPPRKLINLPMDPTNDYPRMPPPPLPPAPPPRVDSERQLPPPPPYPGTSQLMSAHHQQQQQLQQQHQQQQQQQQQPPPPAYACPRERFEIPPPTPPRNDAVTPREPPPPPPPLSRIKPPTYPGDKMKPLPVHAPVAALVVGPNNYLDVHATRTGPVLLPYLTPPPPPPPPPSASQPPAAPQASLATVYTGQVARNQIEQYQQQLYSDVDYVIYPLKDPALSQQEYIDAKQGSMLAAMAAAGYHQVAPPPPPPPYPSKTSLMYRSTPYLATATGGGGSSSLSASSMSNRYASNQNLASSLSDTNSSAGNNYLIYGGLAGSHYTASTGSLYSGYGAGYGTNYGADNRIYTSPPPPPLPPATHHLHTASRRVQAVPPVASRVSRTRSHDNILESCYEAALASPLKTLSLSRAVANVSKNSYKPSLKHRRLPPPPPPPPYDLQSLSSTKPTQVDDGINDKAPEQDKEPQSQQSQQPQQNGQTNEMLDIKTLREKSKNLDLPLISALCNDRYLLKQTKAFVLPKHAKESQNGTSTKSSNLGNGTTTTSSRHKYPVSGLSTTQMSKPPRKSATSSHKHPSAVSFSRSKDLVNIYQVNSTGVSSLSDKKNLSRASHS